MCCKVMGIPELDKPAGVWCPKCDKTSGCTEYGSRPDPCRGFECVWLQSQHQRHGEDQMPPELRPDRCHVVIDVRTDSKGLVFHVDPNRPGAVDSGPVKRFMDWMLELGHEVVVAHNEKRKLIRLQRAPYQSQQACLAQDDRQARRHERRDRRAKEGNRQNKGLQPQAKQPAGRHSDFARNAYPEECA